jgi:hypothetical protein
MDAAMAILKVVLVVLIYVSVLGAGILLARLMGVRKRNATVDKG